MTCHTHKQTRQTHYQAWAKRELNYVNNHQVKQVENYIPHTSIWNYLIKLYPMWRHTLERQHEHCLLRHWRLLHHHGTIATGQRLHCHLPVSLSWLVHTIQALQGRNIEKNGIILILKTCKFTQQVVRWWYMRCVSLHRCEKHSRCVGWNIASMWRGLVPLSKSVVLEMIDLSECKREIDVVLCSTYGSSSDGMMPSFSESQVLPILHSILNEGGSSLKYCVYPGLWEWPVVCYQW